MLALVDALNIMDAVDERGRSLPFSIAFVKKSTGEIIRIPDASKPRLSRRVEMRNSFNATKAPDVQKKNPNHYLNNTRNIVIGSSQQIRKIHIRLITEFNGHKIFQ